MPARVPPLNVNALVPDVAGAQQNALLTRRMQATNELLGQQARMGARDLEMRPMRDEAEAVSYITEIAPMITWDKYPQSREWLISRNNINPDFLPPAEEIATQAQQAGMDPAQYFEAWKRKGLQTLTQQRQGLTAEASYLNAIKPKEVTPTELEKLITAMDELPEGDPRRSFYKQRINKLVQQTGMVVRTTPDGGIELIQGAPVSEMQKKTKGDIEGKIISGKEQLERMKQIYGEFKPEYQELGTRFKNAWTGTKAFLGMGVEEKDRKQLEQFGKFRRKAIENINLYIKELTGAQMSEKEADRLRLAQPDPGENWWNGDDPITFKAKMEDVMKMTRAAVARWEYYKAKGLQDAQIKALVEKGAAESLETIASRIR